MGGYTPVKCVTVYWRGRKVCKHSVPKLDAWAKGSGAAFYVKPIQGCYSTAVSASANTHAGGGVYDVECDGYTLAVATAGCNAGRKAMLITFLRWWKNADGSSNHHIHLVDPACPDMDPSAAEQVEQFRRGETGLVGTSDKDTWDRSTAAAMLRQFDTRHNTPTPAPVPAPAPVKARTYTIPSGGTLAKAAAVLGATVAAVAAFNGISNPNVVHPGQVVKAPPSGYTAPAVVRPTVSAPKPTVRPPAPVVKPKPSAPVRKPSRPVVRPVSRVALKPGRTNASVKAYERALAARGYLAWRYADGFYGTATSGATRAAYRHYGWTPWATVPGPALLKALGLKSVR